MKKLLAGAASAAMLLSTVMPALAMDGGNVAIIKNNSVTVVGNSGLNLLTASSKTVAVAVGKKSTATANGGGATNNLTTGSVTAKGAQVIVANINKCGCEEDGHSHNVAVVKRNSVNVEGNSGLNLLDASSKTVAVAVGKKSTATANGGGATNNLTTGSVTAKGFQVIAVNIQK